MSGTMVIMEESYKHQFFQTALEQTHRLKC
nr:MAG TPA: hypothetical protein [Bacteriophage sp.]